MTDTDQFTDLQILAMTLIGEFESMGETGMTQGACVIMNRAKENIHWMGGNNVRKICLQPLQFSCWNDDPNNKDRKRIINIASTNPSYGAYVLAARIAGDAINGRINDSVGGAVSYINHLECHPKWAAGKEPAFINEPVWFYAYDQIC